jgi:hypothetical protein
MTTIDLYRKHKAGKVSREKFLYEVRRDNNLPFITNLTSYDDAVKILKNKGIVTEDEQKKQDANSAFIKKADVEKKIVDGLKNMGYQAYRDATMRMIRADKKLEKGGTLVVYIKQSRDSYLKNVSGELSNTLSVDISYLDTETTKKFFGLVKNQTKKVKDLTDKEGQDIDLGNTMDDIPVDQSVNKILDVVKKAEQKASQMSEVQTRQMTGDEDADWMGENLNESETKEAKAAEAVKAEVKPKAVKETKKQLNADQVHPYEYRLGIQCELDKIGEYSDESLEKAKTIVLKNLSKDFNYYTNEKYAKQSPYTFKQTETDKPGMQAKADGYLKKEAKKDEKANVKDNLGKKEAGTTKPKGVKVMPDKGVTGNQKTIKEGLEEENIVDFCNTHFDELQKMFGKIRSKFESTTLKNGIEVAYAGSDEDDGIDISFDPNYKDLSDIYNDIESYELAGRTIYVNNYLNPNIEDEDTMEEGSFMGGVDLGSSFDKMKQDIIGNKEDFELADEDAFKDLMKKYDFYAEMSDDSRKWDAQQAMNNQLKQLAKKIGVEKAVELFNQKAPANRKVNASFFGMNENKHAKIKDKLKKDLKELISQTDIIAARTSGKPINVSKSNSVDIKALQNSKANFTTYE